jgi:hypothetical protein
VPIQTLEDIRKHGLIPPNLSALGIKRAVGTDKDGPPDLETVWKTPYPVLTNYETMCLEAQIKAYAGGTRERQGPSWAEGYISSGFRELLGADDTPHKFGLAIDVVIIGLLREIEVARIAVKYFMRVGIYPDDNIMHFDLAPVIWQICYKGTPFWVKLNESQIVIVDSKRTEKIKPKYYPFYDLERAIAFALERRG